jgi:hypothetical protein
MDLYSKLHNVKFEYFDKKLSHLLEVIKYSKIQNMLVCSSFLALPSIVFCRNILPV